MNELFLLIHTLIISIAALIALKLGKHCLIAFIAAQSILANLFVVKQITLFGFNGTASDAFMIGSIFGLHLLQEYYGTKEAQNSVKISFFCLFFTRLYRKYICYILQQRMISCNSIFILFCILCPVLLLLQLPFIPVLCILIHCFMRFLESYLVVNIYF